MKSLSRILNSSASAVIVLVSSAWMVLAPIDPTLAANEVNQARDFSGMWSFASTSGSSFGRDALGPLGVAEVYALLSLIGVDLPYTPQGQDIAADHLEAFNAGHSIASAHLMCRPTGVQGVTAPKAAVLVMQASDKIVFISQEDREVRRVYIDRAHPKNLRPTYSGHSVSHWEGNTLVIDTIGYNDKGQLDEVGNPQSTQMHVVERLTKSADGSMFTDELTITDPVYYTRPFTVKRTFRRAPGARVFDYDCAQNPRSDDFSNFTFNDDWFKPVCVLPVTDNVVAEKVICSRPQARSGGANSSRPVDGLSVPH